MPAGESATASYDPDFPMVGETLGLWRLTRGIGRGGMGEVYAAEYDYLHLLTLRYPPEERGLIRAELAELPRDEQARLAGEMLGTQLPPEARFAIKICSAREGTAGYRRFLQESEMASRLGVHPHIVTVHAVNGVDRAGGATATYETLEIEGGKYRDLAYMVMDLAVCDYDHKHLQLAEAVHVIRCIATALDHAHTCGIVHRDLKPENLLGSVAHPLLTDFGIAKELDQSLGLTRTGQVIGTLDYMSPEQATDAKNVDYRSDIYSLGVVLYEMSTGGQLPYIHLGKREAALAAIRSEKAEPKWPRQHRADFPRGLEYIILKAMAHRPAARYQQMSELISDLDRWQRGEWLSPIGRVSLQRWWRMLCGRHPRALWATAVCLGLVLLAWGLLVLKRNFDTVRVSLEQELGAFRDLVTAIEQGHQQQAAELEQLRNLQRAFEQHGEAYPELAADWQDLQRRLDAARWLQVSVGPEAGREVFLHEGQRQLRLAIAGDLDIVATPDAGLRFPEAVQLRFKESYGVGQVYVNLLVDLPAAPMRWRLSDQARRNAVELAYERLPSGRWQLSLGHYRDERPEPDLLYREVLPPPVRLDAALQVGDDGLIFFLPKMRSLQHYQQPVLRPQSPVEISGELPAGSVLKYLEIRPGRILGH